MISGDGMGSALEATGFTPRGDTARATSRRPWPRAHHQVVTRCSYPGLGGAGSHRAVSGGEGSGAAEGASPCAGVRGQSP